MVISLLKGKGLPNKCWRERVATSVYLLNIPPTKVMLNQHHMKFENYKMFCKPLNNFLGVFVMLWLTLKLIKN